MHSHIISPFSQLVCKKNISTNMNDSNSTGARGIMFTITAKQNIVFRGLDILARRKNAVKVSMYTRKKDYSNLTYPVDGWQPIF